MTADFALARSAHMQAALSLLVSVERPGNWLWGADAIPHKLARMSNDRTSLYNEAMQAECGGMLRQEVVRNKYTA